MGDVSRKLSEEEPPQSRNRVSQTSRSTGSSWFSGLKMGFCFGYPSSQTNSITPSTPGTNEVQTRNKASQTLSLINDDDDDQESKYGKYFTVSNLRVYSFADLKSATRNFRVNQILGEGELGFVYRGWMDDKTLQPCKPGTGVTVAVKKLNPERTRGFLEWQHEVNFIGRLSHPNLVKLLGYCCEDKRLVLVYEFMQKGRPNIKPLSWDMRISIAIGAARGLAFLHSSEKHVIYGDFKTSNILLDGNYNAKISDFGLTESESYDPGSNVATTGYATYGCAAPEYVATGLLHAKSEVYGFGVVLLEMLTGLRGTYIRGRSEHHRDLLHWLKKHLHHSRKLEEIMDASMKGRYSFKAALQTAQIAQKCLELNPETRPLMKVIVEELEQVQAIKELELEQEADLNRMYFKELPRFIPGM